LLRAFADADSSFDRPFCDFRCQLEGSSAETDEPLPEAIGPYRILRLLGHGGMGRVYLAERTDSDRQRVAVKVLKRGLNSCALVRRFHSERQILSRLEHPFIARILDGGSTADGRPYLVMEHVDGLPIDRYCDEHDLDVGARLELMRKVCEAVQLAHRNLVVHRDLKPANILVTAAGDPKLLDFGIAKLLRPEAFPTVPATAPGLIPMTPHYASPEQARGEPVTTASDVYSLGVLLYELLTSHRPHQVTTGDPSEVARTVCGQEPRQPSMVIFRPDRQHWSRRLRGDVDTIVLTALRQEPERRYASVEQLAEDIRRHLAGRPVLARPDVLACRIREVLRRHRRGVQLSAAALAAAIALLLYL